MVETVKTQADLLSEMADGGDNTAEEVRNGIVSMWTPGWMRYLDHRLADETPTDDDDFFDDDDHSAYTKVAISGTAAWTEAHGRLSVVADDQSSVDAAGAVKALTVSGPPITVETAILMRARQEQNTSTVGVGFTDGTTGSDNIAFANYTVNVTETSIRARSGTLTEYNADQNQAVDGLDENFFSERVYMRCVWTAANTFDTSFSFDGVTWFDLGLTSWSKTMTPSNVILLASTSGGTNPLFITFEYLRVCEADLS